jgi:hypothetical protein
LTGNRHQRDFSTLRIETMCRRLRERPHRSGTGYRTWAVSPAL